MSDELSTYLEKFLGILDSRSSFYFYSKLGRKIEINKHDLQRLKEIHTKRGARGVLFDGFRLPAGVFLFFNFLSLSKIPIP